MKKDIVYKGKKIKRVERDSYEYTYNNYVGDPCIGTGYISAGYVVGRYKFKSLKSAKNSIDKMPSKEDQKRIKKFKKRYEKEIKELEKRVEMCIDALYGYTKNGELY